MRPLVTEHNIETGITETREMNDLEFASYEEGIKLEEIRKVVALEKQQARQALLDRIGLSEEEVELLLNR